MRILNGTKLAAKITNRISRNVKKLGKNGIFPKLAAVLVGDDQASISFINKKEELCKKVGIDFELFKFSANISEQKLRQKIKIIQSDKDLSGLIVQLPLPAKIKSRSILEEIKEEIDVDCLTSRSLGKLAAGIPLIIPPTSAAIFEFIKEYKISFANKHIVVVGRGELVGKPLGIILTQSHDPITLCSKKTKNIKELIKEADILITGVGKKDLISGSMIKKNAVVFDAGTVLEGNKIFGDVNYKTVSKKASMITPVPGGIGPVTVAKLLENVIITTKYNNVDKLS